MIDTFKEASNQAKELLDEQRTNIQEIKPCGPVKSRLGFIRHCDYWILPRSLPYLAALENFQPSEKDVWLASVCKAGATWTKALLHCIVSLASATPDMLYLHSPHGLVPCVELDGLRSDTDVLPRRILHTHLPFHALPPSLQSCSSSKIVYVTRNPRDTCVSLWKFLCKIAETKTVHGSPSVVSMEAAFDSFCRGHFHGGPFVENVLSYWQLHKKDPDRVLWLQYEDLQSDCVGCVIRIGRFLGYASDLFERNASAIVEKCSFDNLSNAQVNKTGIRENPSGHTLPNSLFFREGKAGGWRQHFSAKMTQRIYEEIERKLEEAGIQFQY